MTQYIIDTKKWKLHCHQCPNIEKKLGESNIGVAAITRIPCKDYKGCIDNYMDHITGKDTDDMFPERKKKRSYTRASLFPTKTDKKKRITFHKQLGISQADPIPTEVLEEIKRTSIGHIIIIGKKKVKVTNIIKKIAVWKLNLRNARRKRK